MAITADIGHRFRQTLTDGRTIEARLTFGDFARAEIAQGSNFLTSVALEGDIHLNDLAALCYQAATRTNQFTGTWDEWLMLLDGFPDMEDLEEGGAEVVQGPFPESTPDISSRNLP